MFEFLAYLTIGLIVLIAPAIVSVAFGRFVLRREFELDESFEDQYFLPFILGGGILTLVVPVLALITALGQGCLQALVGIPS